MDVEAIFGTAIRAAFGPTAAVYALLAIGLNVHYGYTGLLNFGQVGFMLVGAYGVGIPVAILGWSLWVAIPMGLLAGVLLALLLGAPTLRLRADYFAITTIAVAEVLRITFRSTSARDVTGGPFGLQSIANEFYAINPFERGISLGPLDFSAQQSWALVASWALVGLATLLVTLLMRAPWGRVLKAIREDEDAARALGKNVFSFKMQSLVLGGTIGALSGVMFTLGGSTVNADTFRPQITFYAYAILILGGAATRIGPIVGAVIFWFLFAGVQSTVRSMQAEDLLPGVLGGANAVGASALILVGLALTLLVVFRPHGIFGDPRELKLDA